MKIPACLASLSLLFALALTASAAPPVVLLRDSFNGTGTPDSGNINYALPSRQSGALGPVTYTPGGNVQVGNGGEPHDGGNVLLCAFGGTAALYHNFNNARSAGGLKISFDFDADSHNNNVGNWCAVNLGASEADRNVGVNGGATHFGILFRANGKIQAFDGSTLVTPVEPNWAADGNYSGQLHHIDLVLTGLGDGNPFDGAGDTQIDVYADGGAVPVYSFTKTGGYAQNYVNFQSSFIGDFENLVITAMNPPTPPSEPWNQVAWSGDLDSGVDASYTYTHAYNFSSVNNATINGVTFTGVTGGNPAVAGRFSVAGIPNNFDDDGGANVTGGSTTLARSFIYGGNPGTLTVQGLTPGTQYLLTIYTKAWEVSGNRIIKFTAGSDQRVIDQNSYGRFDGSRNGNRITYAYTASASGTLTVTLAPLVAANSLHFYGFSNREGTPAPASAWSYSEWTSDATSGVSPAHAYTHAYNFGSAANVTLNGITFTGNSAQNPSVPGVFSVGNFFASYGGGYGPEITGAGLDLARQFIYDGRPGNITLNGLTPGKRYVLSLFSASFGPPGRLINFLANGDLKTIDQDAHTGTKGIVINYPYTADASGTLTAQIITVNPGWAFHLCGLANREEAVATAPVFNTQPADLTVAEGEPATFAVAVAGTAPLNYQWYFGPDVLPGETGSTLVVPTDFPDVAGPYSVVVNNAFGSVTSRVATLIVRLPVPGLFNTGVDANGVALPDNSVDPHYTLIVNPDSGSPNAIVENSAAFPIAAGPWLANATNSKWIGPRFDTAGAAGQAVGGGLYTFRINFDLTGLDVSTINITGGWAVDNFGAAIRVNGTDTGIQNGGGFGGLTAFAISGANATFLPGINTLEFVVRNDDAVAGYIGLYVRNLRGLATPPNTPPTITAQPQSQTAGTTETVSFTVTATGSSPLSYQWTRGGVNLPGATTATLTLNNLTHADAGTYAVTVTNLYGALTSSNAVLVVRDLVPGVFNTGVDDFGDVLGDGVVDPHYRLLVNPDSASADAFLQDSTVFPIVAGPWVPNAADSKWIGPRVETSLAAGGDYTYRLVVDLTGFDPASIAITGEWATDNAGLDILVNGVASGNANAGQFVTYTPFAITSGLLAGLNTIDFKVNNAAAGYTGLRVRRLHALGDLLPPGTPPFIVASPQSRLVQLGDTATFLVRANGSLPLSYQWFVGPDALPGETGPTLSVLADFPDVAGSYSVRITSAFGSATSAPAVLTINQPPIAADNGAATSQGSALTLAVGKLLANDSDPDGNPLTVTAVSATSANNGAVTLAAGVVTYSPPAAFTGLDQFSYTISDGRGGSATAQVVVLVVSGSLPGANQVSLTPVGSGYRLRFAGIPGRSYDVQRAPAVDGPWTTLATLVAPLHGIIEYLDANPPPGAAFYRTVAP